jgi:hypothetical protein
MWVASGQGGASTVGYSYDGVTWYAGTANSGSPVFFDYAYNGYIWVGMSQVLNYSVYYSYDGINWLLSSSGTSILLLGQSVAWNGKMWVGGARQNESSGSFLAYSYDGINWTAASISSDYTLSYMWKGGAIAWNGSLWIAAFAGGILTSIDGITWSSQTNATNLGGNIGWSVASRNFTLRPSSATSTKQALSGSATSSTDGILAVTFTSKIFSTATPIVTATVTGTTPGYVTVSGISVNGFTANTFDSGATGTSGITFNWIAINP